MKKARAWNLLIPLGLLCIISTYIIKHYTPIPDMLDGFLKGAGLALVVSPWILAKFSKKAS